MRTGERSDLEAYFPPYHMRKAEGCLLPVFNHVERLNYILEVERRESLNIFLFKVRQV